MKKKVYGVEVWHGTTAVYCDMFESLEDAQAHVEWCKANARDGWYRVVYGPYEFESRHEFSLWQSETEGMK